MRILILGDINSAHIRKWCLALAQRGLKIGIYSMDAPQSDWYKQENILLLSNPNVNTGSSWMAKFSYYSHIRKVKSILKEFTPDIVHAHYATSYGMLARAANFHPMIISVWGSDVFDFPKRNFLSSSILRKNLYKADRILATGHALKIETEKYTHKEIIVTPFGIDTNHFRPLNKTVESCITIGMVKSMEDIYGVDILLDAFNVLLSENENMKLILIGDGSKLKNYKLRVESMGISDKVFFEGRKNNVEIPESLSKFDIAVFPSRMESFGVAQLEASACGLPVVSSAVGGVPEVVNNGVTGLLISPVNVTQLVSALSILIKDSVLREKMGNAGREFVIQNFDLNKNVDQMIDIYQNLLKERNNLHQA